MVTMWIGLFVLLEVLAALSIAVTLGWALMKYLDWAEKTAKLSGWGCGLFAAGLVYFMMSTTTVPATKVGLLTRHYGGSPMKPGKILAMAGENGPQADVLAQGFNHKPFLYFFYDVEFVDVVQVKEGELAMLTAKDGEPLAPDQAFADAFDPKEEKQMIEDANHFLTAGGKKGPQTTVLKPGSYRLNTYLWSHTIGQATKVDAGQVGVITSNVHSRVDFGNLKREKPTEIASKTVKAHEKDTLSVNLVPVGAIGVWEESLTPGLYYIHTGAYRVMTMDTKIQTWTYRGGYVRRVIDLEVDDRGEITQKVREIPAEKDPNAADDAVEVMVEGWLAHLELRVLGQVTPENAPYVSVAIGNIEEVENRIITPNLRSVVRNVLGGEAVLDDSQHEGKKRPPKALDVYEAREALEKATLEDMKSVCETVRVLVTEVRFGDPGMPPELLVARKREQLAQQLQKSYKEEQLAQAERVKREKTKAEAEAQKQLAEAEVSVKAAEMLKEKLRSEGEGEKEKLMAIAEGQKTQVEALGKEEVVRLRQFELLLEKSFDLLEKNPKLLEVAISNAQKFVPERVITVGTTEGNGMFAGPAAIIGEMLSPSQPSSGSRKKTDSTLNTSATTTSAAN